MANSSGSGSGRGGWRALLTLCPARFRLKSVLPPQLPSAVPLKTELAHSVPSACADMEEAAEEPREAEEERICRFCFEGDGAEDEALISPCNCSGGQKYVHLKCLRMWQRTVLVSQPTHPDLYDVDTRQRICNVCKVEFSCPPPTRTELLASFTGPELAALIEEGCVIGSARDFSEELDQQVSTFPEAVRDRIICRNWVRGVFLILKVVEDRRREQVMLRVTNEEALQALVEQLEMGSRALHLRGRRYVLLPEGPLENLSEDESSDAWRAAIQAVETPATFRVRLHSSVDCGEDGVVAVNLTRPMHLDAAPQTTLRDHQQSVYQADVARVLGNLELDEDRVTHFIGGPCEEEKVAGCIVTCGETYSIFHGSDCLEDGLRRLARGLRHREATSYGEFVTSAEHGQEVIDVPAGPPAFPPPHHLAEEAPVPASKRRRLTSVSTEDTTAPDSEGDATRSERSDSSDMDATDLEGAPSQVDPPGQPSRPGPRLFVFWGYAGWSRCQLMGEIARGSWGLCRSYPQDVIESAPSEVWQQIYERLMFAPQSEMSESYGGRAPEEEARRRAMRRMAIFSELFRRQLSRARRANLEEEEEAADEDDAEVETDATVTAAIAPEREDENEEEMGNADGGVVEVEAASEASSDEGGIAEVDSVDAEIDILR